MTAEQIRHARDLLTRPDNTVSSIARLLGVSRATIYKYVPDVDRAPERCPASWAERRHLALEIPCHLPTKVTGTAPAANLTPAHYL